jgi:hypothetical protein
MNPPNPSTHDKAFAINLHPAQYGTFAEIGAGQEVARWFFHVGGAAATVARSISAYDMAMSTATYGPAARYVSRQRLQAMLEYEFHLLLTQLDAVRGERSTFFVFANTVAARSYTHQEDGHGWLGVRFQTRPREAPSDLLIHVRLLDRDNLREQEALGVLGVNLLYAAFHHSQEPDVLIRSLLEGLTRDRAEVDVLQCMGPGFAGVDNRLLSLQLVEQRLTDAAMFTVEGEVVQPSEILYKRPILVERGSFRPPTNLTLDLLACALERFRLEPQVQEESPVVLLEMTLRDLTADRGLDHADFLARVDLLRAVGQNVLISNFGRYFRLVDYLAGYTQKPIGIAVGIPTLREIFDAEYYSDLPGGRLESIGRLFKNAVKVYVYPSLDPTSGDLMTVETLAVEPQFRHLKAFLLENHYVEPLGNYNKSYLPIVTRDVLAKIQTGDPAWEALVPPRIAQLITQHKLFSYQPTREH